MGQIETDDKKWKGKQQHFKIQKVLLLSFFMEWIGISIPVNIVAVPSVRELESQILKKQGGKKIIESGHFIK